MKDCVRKVELKAVLCFSELHFLTTSKSLILMLRFLNEDYIINENLLQDVFNQEVFKLKELWQEVLAIKLLLTSLFRFSVLRKVLSLLKKALYHVCYFTLMSI